MIGLIGGLGLLILLTIRGVNILVAAPVCALIIAITSGLPFFAQVAAAGQTDFVSAYMSGFTGFIASWFFMFLLGAIFGEVMAVTGAADSIAHWVITKFGIDHAILAVVTACALLTYGGVSVFIVAFSVYPMAVSLFKKANLPRRFIPGTLAFGSVTFTMTSAGSPEIQNWIPMQYLGTDQYAGWQVSLIVALIMASLGYVWLLKMVRKAVDNGEHFEDRIGDNFTRSYKKLPNPLLSLVPLTVVLVIAFTYHESLKTSALIVALGGGVLMAMVINLTALSKMVAAWGKGATGAVVAITNTAAVVGFGTVAKASPAFDAAVNAMINLPGNELVGAAVAVTVIAGLTGSASGGQSIALPLLAPHYLDTGVDPGELHRVVAIASGALDSLPHNGYVVTTIRAICGETHHDAYGPLGKLTVIVPLIGLIIAIGLFIVF